MALIELAAKNDTVENVIDSVNRRGPEISEHPRAENTFVQSGASSEERDDKLRPPLKMTYRYLRTV